MKRQSRRSQSWRSWNAAALGKAEKTCDDYQLGYPKNNMRKDIDLRPWNRISLHGSNEVKPEPQDKCIDSSKDDYTKSGVSILFLSDTSLIDRLPFLI